MSDYSNSRRSSSHKSPHKKSGTQRFGNKFNSGPAQPKRSGSAGRGQRPVKKFDPSLFIRKVEERSPAATYEAKHTFADFLIDDLIKKNIAEHGYIKPTPIQDQVIPLLLEGRDVIATANTGTGKTAAFLIPLLQNVLSKKIERVLIITPTRELADQILKELNIFKRNSSLYAALCIGGVNIGRQIRALAQHPAFVIGTPGRLLDLGQQGFINFKKYNAVVLDEVDTMLDMGFLKDIKAILAQLPAKRHTLFFSATIPQDMQTLMSSFLQSPVSVSVKSRQSAENVNQEVIKVGNQNKLQLLHELLIRPDVKKSILFVRTKRSADKLAKILIERGFNVATIHGNKSQAQRSKALALFKENKVTILVATDVVARGIDIDDVSHVINVDLPETHEDYIHRIGRTGRADKIGQAITLID